VMRTLSAETSYSRRLDALFKHPATDAAMLVLISMSVAVAAGSLLVDNEELEHLNLYFSLLFSVELTARYFTYASNKREYFADWWMDWIAAIPWDIFLFFLFPGGGASMLRLLRLPRIFRLLRFRHLKHSDAARRLSYRFRRLMEVSIFRQILTMLLVSFVFVWIFTTVLDGLGVQSEHGNNFWFSIITMISSDSIFEIHNQETLVKVLVLILSFIGIVLFNGVLIAIIIGKLMEHLDDLKQGRGDVRERGHIILLGWNECIPHIVDELESYCRTERKRLIRVVVMREHPPESPDQVVESRPHVEVISRTGSFQNAQALERISAHKASAVVVLGGRAADRKLSERLNDPIVTRTLVALETLLDSKPNERHSPVIVLNYLDLSRSCHVTEFLRPFGNRSTKVFFNPLFFTGKLIASMCINPYAEDIFNELLTPEGNEFHFVRLPPGEKMLWRDMMNAFPKSIPVGYRDASGELRMVPRPDEEVPESAEVVVLSENACDASIFTPPPPGRLPDARAPSPRCKNILPSGMLVIVGVNPQLPFIVEETCSLGMTVHIVDNQTKEEFAAWYDEYSRTPLPESVVFRECRFRSEEEICAAIALASADRIILLADGHLLDAATPDQIDAETISKLLMLGQLIEEQGREGIHLIVETLTLDSEVVVRNIRNCSNVIGPLTIGRLLTTFTLQPEFEALFRTIIQYGEIDIACRPALDSVPGWKPGETTFADLLAGSRNSCIPLGWVKLPEEGAALEATMRRAAPKVELNPPKSSIVPERSEIVFLHRQGEKTLRP
ncbi:MAG: ion transporter, partial [Synergistaceae bacterium]|nr:ion transporter [Synergistaceae bacterium]